MEVCKPAICRIRGRCIDGTRGGFRGGRAGRAPP